MASCGGCEELGVLAGTVPGGVDCLVRLGRVAVCTVASCVISHHHFISQKNSNGKKTDINILVQGAAGRGVGPRGGEHGHCLALGIAVIAVWARLEGKPGILSVPPGQGDGSDHFRGTY